ncbi:trimeric intracellular cation channel family protein [Gordonia amicalis]|uniref:Trimeric intracellular cation channel family protein n=1 Tax=Gordonia amicalis TaxID=89053 RepID=A0AAE4R3F0_9ACTN|nr:trimeric intracellular cation channel family protein [Gordonia amicalis]MBA5845974.1 trimeric intracellular cation channel family protein [Gordonia amicalis]MCZ4651800.1 trimeric intracellular cation channel family protein [Gordonia amicalis]MDV6311721.1 trimeric intracellular cation channel family protein [Gordonia amicalis]MDV7175450.1 trimeric intracellular cation channel family protein [Gordonia amicalis]NKX78107.1 trimeric intracellular cation channel family protein [Gordonia amicalis]
MLLDVLNFAGVAVFAASGAMVGVRKDFDMWGIVTVGVLTGAGGGVLRDVLLGITPPSSVQGFGNALTGTIASLLVFAFHPAFTKLRRSILVLDAFGMGLFATTGASIAVDVGASAFAATAVGLMTAIGGGVLRDVISNEIPLLLQPADLYAIPALLGATIVAVGSYHTPVPHWVWLTVGSVLATGLRLLGLKFGWRLPTARH